MGRKRAQSGNSAGTGRMRIRLKAEINIMETTTTQRAAHCSRTGLPCSMIRAARAGARPMLNRLQTGAARQRLPCQKSSAHKLKVRQLGLVVKDKSPALIQIRPIAVSHCVTWMACQILDEVLDLGVRKKTPSRCIRPWMQASVTAQPRLKKLYMVAIAIQSETFKRLRNTHRKRRL